jgi:protein TonB
MMLALAAAVPVSAKSGPLVMPPTEEEQLRQYPQAAIDRGEQGTAITSFEIDTEGNPQNCRILRSSGSAELDGAACRTLLGLPDLKAATDPDGKPKMLSASRRIHFILFDEPPSPQMLPIERGDIVQIRERRPVASKSKARVGPPLTPAKTIGNPVPIKPGDYPREARRAGEQGTVRIYYRISQEGRISACRVVESSGSAALDEASCDIITRRSRFEPATDDQGRPAPSFGSRTITWRL